MTRLANITLAGWGNFRPEPSSVQRPERRSELRAAVLGEGDRPHLIPRGLGRSYGDSALNTDGAVVLQERLDALLNYDPATGVVEAEAGVSLATLIDTFLPRGCFLPVTPGTKFVTLGGAIAADVHGKNHHVDGTISQYVRSLRLMTASGEILTCSPAEHADVFWATVGGMGLTGVILSAQLQLIPVGSAYVKVNFHRAAGLEAALDHFEARRTSGNEPKYSVAWIDCVARGEAMGRSVIMEGEHLPASALPDHLKANPLQPPRKKKKNVPLNFPSFALSRTTVRIFNHFYYRKHGDSTQVVDLDSFFYPLDGVHHWNRIYGRRGFVQYQALFPQETARAGLKELLDRVSADGHASFLAVLKRTGEQGPGLLSFPMPGYTLALDLPNSGPKLLETLAGFDEILLRHGGRLYLAKDAAMSPESFAKMYPRLEEFKQIKARIDPAGRFSSTQARRLGIVGPTA